MERNVVNLNYMVTPELLDYIKHQIASGIPQNTIQTNLQASNWSVEDIQSAFNQLNSSTQKLNIRGSLNNFLHTGAIVMTFLWLLIAIGLFISNPKINEQLDIQKNIAILFISVQVIVAVGIISQSKSIDKDYISYSSNFFPLFKRKIRISDIGSIGFGKNFLLPADPTNISKIKMGITDEPIVGFRIYNNQGNVIGGFNTKVFSDKDISLVIEKIKVINPSVKTE